MSVKNEDLLPLFVEVKGLLDPYVQRLTTHKDESGYFDLWSEKDIVIDGRRREGVYFCGVVIQKTHVGFYFMPLYAGDDLASVFGPDLLATLKGKSCFHLKRMTPELRVQIADALDAGWRLYEDRGWV